MMRLLTLILLTFAFPVLAADERAPPRDMVVLTVSGMIGKTNRGPLDAKRDSLLALQKIDFKEAFAFDRATLLSLPQGTVTVQPREFDKPATFSGPLLHGVLGYLEAAQVRPRLSRSTALPAGLDPDDIKSSDWIRALSADGVPLGLGQQGPVWLINTRAPDFKPDETNHAHWVWSVFYIKVGE
jgi:hypothetical protein